MKKETILIPNFNWSEWIPPGETAPFSCKTLACLVIRVIYLTSKKKETIRNPNFNLTSENKTTF